MSSPSAPFDATPIPSEPRERLCPSCHSAEILALGRLFASRLGIRSEYRCQVCATAFWLRAERRVGPPDRRAPS